MTRSSVLLILVTGGCAGMSANPHPKTNPKFAGQALPAPIVWVAPITCIDAAPGRLGQDILKKDAFKHPGAIPPTRPLAELACNELPASEAMFSLKGRQIDESFQASEELTAAIAAIASRAGAQSVVIATAAEHYINSDEANGMTSHTFVFSDYGVFAFDRSGTAHYLVRKEPGGKDTGADIQGLVANIPGSTK